MVNIRVIQYISHYFWNICDERDHSRQLLPVLCSLPLPNINVYIRNI